MKTRNLKKLKPFELKGHVYKMRLSKVIALIVVVAVVVSGAFVSTQAFAASNSNPAVANHSFSSAYTALVQKQSQVLK
ncbi:hypothetical protein [Levilactobacillus acidifarinae]|uniref:hypothetical protein n=1 Tax=Levilactobacillus acidifarinae TaxID=267364 RepID=UPI001F491B12|nr:hypothetical protein [Levilactobacillus acidifarinae]